MHKTVSNLSVSGETPSDILNYINFRITNVLLPQFKLIVDLNVQINKTISETKDATKIISLKKDQHGIRSGAIMMEVTPEFRRAEINRLLEIISCNDASGVAITYEVKRLDSLFNQILESINGNNAEQLSTLISHAKEELKRGLVFS